MVYFVKVSMILAGVSRGELLITHAPSFSTSSLVALSCRGTPATLLVTLANYCTGKSWSNKKWGEVRGEI